MTLLQRLERFNGRLEAKLSKKKDLEGHAEQLQAQIHSVETMLESNAMLAVPPEYLEDTIRLIRRGITATNDIHPVVVTLLVRWCNEQEEYLREGKWEAEAT